MPEHELVGEVIKDLEAQVSLHAILGYTNPQTIRVNGRIGRVQLIVLIDSGSTHNFLRRYVVKRTDLEVKKDVCLDISIANGEHVPCLGRCKGVNMKLQGLKLEKTSMCLTWGFVRPFWRPRG